MSAKLIDRVQPVFQQLPDSGMRIGTDVLDGALRLTGELDSV